MKVLKFFLIGLFFSITGMMQAQVSVNVNVGTPPPWGPAGYASVNYYYLPDVEAFYDVPSSMFIYNTGGVWVHRAYLPSRYRNYDLYNGYKVVMTDYRGGNPNSYYKEFKTKYGKGYRGPSQKTIGERPGNGNSKMNMPGKGNSYKKMNPGNNKMHPGNNKMTPGNSKSAGHIKSGGHDMGGGKGNNGGGKGGKK
jgi:hypothetical protein